MTAAAIDDGVVAAARSLSSCSTCGGASSSVAMACVTAVLISVNWGIYIWAIVSGHALAAALGYYINPLFSILLAAVFLGERLTRAQLAAIALAAAAVVVLTIEAGRIPWVSLVLTVSWGFYALAKKSLPIGPNQGFLLEVLILIVPALGYLGYLTATAQSHFSLSLTRDTWLLLGCGAVTAVRIGGKCVPMMRGELRVPAG